MRLIRMMRLTPHQAKELTHLGFIIKFMGMVDIKHDLYEIYVKA